MEVKIDMLPGCTYSSNVLYKQASDKKELDAIIKDAKDNVCAYRISIDGKIAYESQGSGAKKRWFKSHVYFR